MSDTEEENGGEAAAPAVEGVELVAWGVWHALATSASPEVLHYMGLFPNHSWPGSRWHDLPETTRAWWVQAVSRVLEEEVGIDPATLAVRPEADPLSPDQLARAYFQARFVDDAHHGDWDSLCPAIAEEGKVPLPFDKQSDELRAWCHAAARKLLRLARGAGPRRPRKVSERGLYEDERNRAIEAFEREYVQDLIEEAGGNVSEASRLAGFNRATFYRLLERLGMRPEDQRPGAFGFRRDRR